MQEQEWYDSLKPRALRRWWRFHSREEYLRHKENPHAKGVRKEKRRWRRKSAWVAEPGQSGRAVVCVDSSFDVTALVMGDRLHSNLFVGRLTREHCERTGCKEEHYAVQTFQSKREMKRELVRRWGSFSRVSWRHFKVVWLRR